MVVVVAEVGVAEEASEEETEILLEDVTTKIKIELAVDKIDQAGTLLTHKNNLEVAMTTKQKEIRTRKLLESKSKANDSTYLINRFRIFFNLRF